VARDRKRAKQRRQRGAGAAVRRRAADDGANGAQAHSPLDRADVPGALEHASGDVDEFDAALVQGAGGVPALPDTGAPHADDTDEGDGDYDLDSDDALQETAGGAGGGGLVGGGGRAGLAERPSGAPLRGGNRAIGFLRASWAELQRVQWPDRRQVFQATAVVIGFVAIAGAYLGLADYVAKELVELVL
jgi:preprotein translocase SecE subunit